MSRLTIAGRQVHRFDIFYVNLGNPTSKGIQAGPRPAVVCTPDEGLHENTEIMLISPISAQTRDDYPFLQRVKMPKSASSLIHFEQVRPINIRLVDRYMRSLTKREQREMDTRLAVPTGLADTSFLNITSIKLVNMEPVEGTSDIVFVARINKIFGYKDVMFRFSDLVRDFGPKKASVAASSTPILEHMLEHVSGLNFLYDRGVNYKLSPEEKELCYE